MLKRLAAASLVALASFMGSAAAWAQETGAATPAAPAPEVHEKQGMAAAFFVVLKHGEIEWFGSLLVWSLIIMSFVCTSLMIMFFLKSRRPVLLPQASVDTLNNMLENKQFKEALDYAEGDPSYLGKITAAALRDAPYGFSAMERALEESAAAELARKQRPYEVLNIVGNVGPMLGLFGTVQGMIVSFFEMVNSGGNSDPQALASGIATALVATFWGMVVAIPALVAYAVLRNMTEHNCAEALIEADAMIARFRPKKEKKPASTPEAAGMKPRSAPRPE